ncbi:hypothetical protein CEXT_351751 [Caerostris extrusa]|uniref:Uncharacterized protein n=1 Tax=Caerostris extrusa TaxID=172846 RepID=A0AAV4RRM0_CAEEX|nr:hypothetical protein CEXT_351751 [Caerostris extrusa]
MLGSHVTLIMASATDMRSDAAFPGPKPFRPEHRTAWGEGACAGAPSSHPVPSSILHPCDYLRQNERKSSRTDYLFVRGGGIFGRGS